jgi:hypothetical protein
MDHQDRDFELISIENRSKNIPEISKYKDKNGLNRKYVTSTDEVKYNCQIDGVAAFFYPG